MVMRVTDARWATTRERAYPGGCLGFRERCPWPIEAARRPASTAGRAKGGQGPRTVVVGVVGEVWLTVDESRWLVARLRDPPPHPPLHKAEQVADMLEHEIQIGGTRPALFANENETVSVLHVLNLASEGRALSAGLEDLRRAVHIVTSP